MRAGRRFPAAILAVAALALAGPAAAQPATATGPSVTLYAAEFPERYDVDVPFGATDRAPTKAFLEASVKVKAGQATIDLSFTRMAPALLFGGDVTSYVVWAVTRDGIAENLGELWVRGDSGSASVRTGQKTFGLMVTAEAHPFVTKPSSLVVFTSRPVKSDHTKSSPVTFSGLRPAPKIAVESIAGLRYTGREPVDLAQAAKALAQAEALDTGGSNADRIREARTNLAQAANSNAGGSADAMADYSRRSLAKSGEVIRDAEKRVAEAAEEQARLAAKQAEKERALSSRALSESERIRTATAVEALRLEGERARQAAEQARLNAERDALSARLSGALAKVAEVRSSGRGLILTLPSVLLFDGNKTVLKPAGQVALAKLAGILLILSDLNLRVEGFTDATGKVEANQNLSRVRAESVAAFLVGQGVAPARMRAEGYGPANPVAPNDTAANKARNRRVEVVLAEGEIQPASNK